jgi:uncharacterized protein (TIGR02145 family)
MERKAIIPILLIPLIMPLVLAACIFDDSEEEKWDAAKVCPETGTNAYGMPNRGTFTDERDGNVYRYTTIGDQVWMAENLRFELPALYSMCYGYGMGYCYPQNRALTDTAITCVKDTASLAEIAQRMQSTCTDNDCIAREFCDKFGRYYAFNDRVPLKTYSILNRDIVDSVCPKGWHLPTKAEWVALRASVENEYLRLTSDDARYTDTVYREVGSDDCGFSALRGGSIGGKTHRGGALYYAFSSGYYWAAPDGNQNFVERMALATNDDPFGPDSDFLSSIRCIKDSPL